MSLTISVLVPDGIVLAADSLQSTNTALVGEQEANVPCPKCQEQMKFKIPIGPIMMPAGGSPFAQKLFNRLIRLTTTSSQCRMRGLWKSIRILCLSLKNVLPAKNLARNTFIK
jgi:hypothetical protein